MQVNKIAKRERYVSQHSRDKALTGLVFGRDGIQLPWRMYTWLFVKYGYDIGF